LLSKKIINNTVSITIQNILCDFQISFITAVSLILSCKYWYQYSKFLTRFFLLSRELNYFTAIALCTFILRMIPYYQVHTVYVRSSLSMFMKSNVKVQSDKVANKRCSDETVSTEVGTQNSSN